nr:MAG TPA: hypothetical protein [Caudoviricetes sp.]DAQ99332.1 MAG TPA: hypothetical protein [Caudoviricetes sp.]
MIFIIIPFLLLLFLSGFSESAYKSPVSCKLTVQKYEREKAETIINFKPFYLPLKYRIISPEQKNSPGSFEPRLNINSVVCFLQRLGNYLFSIFPLSFKNTACS